MTRVGTIDSRRDGRDNLGTLLALVRKVLIYSAGLTSLAVQVTATARGHRCFMQPHSPELHLIFAKLSKIMINYVTLLACLIGI